MYIIKYLLEASLVVQCTVGALLLLSVLTWSTFFNKLTSIKIMESRMRDFDNDFWSGKTIEELDADGSITTNSNPLGHIFKNTMITWNDNNALKNKSIEINSNIMIRVKETIDASFVDLQPLIYKYQSFLLTATSLSPLIGLFGTVCGIIDTFHAIDINGNTNISVIAPGIAEALITTAFSMLIAIFAAAMYNYFNVKGQQIENKMNLFTLQLEKLLSNTLDNTITGVNMQVATVIEPKTFEKPKPEAKQQPQKQPSRAPSPPSDDDDI